MKYLTEYRNPALVKDYLAKIHRAALHPWKIMEVCGGQTHSLVKNGMLGLLPENVVMIHGPGCPVCVTPMSLIDQAVQLSLLPDVILCSFGDMVRVPGNRMSLLQAKARGGDVRILYSPLEAVHIAAANPAKQVVFFAVGFETTAPSNALAILYAKKLGVSNFALLASHVLVPPAMEAILDDPFCSIDGFLGAGHVCAIMGLGEYHPLAAKYRVPIVVAGFEPVDLLRAIYHTVLQLESGQYEVENQYTRAVREEGNKRAKEVMYEVFEVGSQEWRGIGHIPDSGLVIKDTYRAFDASRIFMLANRYANRPSACIAGDILKGYKKPFECPAYGKACIPANPLGAPMVSSEGACAAYYNYR
ncbi:hydrogenase formation protein HypD [Parapedobacter koreensis]|uniref:Hydrogenase expression/formation protein HypD n=1 Tax=Parapedobacter koreensis TaxID=332977 RepID=A0A1H7TLD2_9SPHI|nr:hydrogenase formation protein HypD [Parapedobacter koreensis]SEL85503.1 hydrogenase expression/formation protein HypD [Parapedobacter koreensis]